MINFAGMKAEKFEAAFPMLPAGPYVGKITNVRVDGEMPRQSLVISVDITEGEHAQYFARKYRHDCENKGQYEPKYRGDYKLRIPHPDSGSQYPESDKRKFNDAMWRVEQSNPGYHWDGNEIGLIGKAIGISIQDGSYNDKPFTAVGRLEIVDDIRNGLVKKMNPRKPSYSSDYYASQPAGYAPVTDPDDPF